MRGDALPVDSCEGPRWRTALEVLKEGGYVVFKGVGLTLRDDGARGKPQLGTLRARVQSGWQAQNLSEARALEDLSRGAAIVDDLIARSPEIREVVEQRGMLYELLDDYGTGAVLIATMSEGRIDWRLAPWRTR